jgi:hypothetical protein
MWHFKKNEEYGCGWLSNKKYQTNKPTRAFFE